MNENANVMSALVIALGQIQNLKGKIDDEVLELLTLSGKDAIKSAHHFLDACEKTIEIISENSAKSTEESEELDIRENVVDLKTNSAGKS